MHLRFSSRHLYTKLGVRTRQFNHRMTNKHTLRAAQKCILVTNDDGVDSKLTKDLTESLENSLGCRVVMVAPATNKSAASMALSLRQEMHMHKRPDIGADAYSLTGSPADCVMAALDPTTGLLAALKLQPMLVVSGPNYGVNFSFDILHSGTVGAARVGAMLGVPAIATSSVLLDRSASDEGVVNATTSLVKAALEVLEWQPAANWPRDFGTKPHGNHHHGRRHMPGSTAYHSHNHPEDSGTHELLRDAFSAGDLLLNINVPLDWNTAQRPVATTGLGIMYYYNQFETIWLEQELTAAAASAAASSSSGNGNGGGNASAFNTQSGTNTEAQPSSASAATATMPAHGSPEGTRVATYHNKYSTRSSVHVEGSDIWALERGMVSITPLQTWPEGHPLCLKDALMAAAMKQGASGLPAWLAAE